NFGFLKNQNLKDLGRFTGPGWDLVSKLLEGGTPPKMRCVVTPQAPPATNPECRNHFLPLYLNRYGALSLPPSPRRGGPGGTPGRFSTFEPGPGREDFLRGGGWGSPGHPPCLPPFFSSFFGAFSYLSDHALRYTVKAVHRKKDP